MGGWGGREAGLQAEVVSRPAGGDGGAGLKGEVEEQACSRRWRNRPAGHPQNTSVPTLNKCKGHFPS